MQSVTLVFLLNGCKSMLPLAAPEPKQYGARLWYECLGLTVFLTGGRRQKFRDLPEEERRTQAEEAYARATAALTCARKMCAVFCPLDMKGIIGTAYGLLCMALDTVGMAR